jgi:hypothetical protein
MVKADGIPLWSTTVVPGFKHKPTAVGAH